MKFRLAFLLTMLLASSLVGAQTPAGSEVASNPLVDEAETLLVRIAQRQKEIAEWEELRTKHTGEDLRAIERELAEKQISALSDLHNLAAIIVEQEEEGLADAAVYRERIEPLMRELPARIREHLETVRKSAGELRLLRENAVTDELLDIEQQIARLDERTLRITNLYLDHVLAMESMGLETTEERAWLETGLTRLAGLISGRIELTLERQDELTEQIEATPEEATLKAESLAVEERLTHNVSSLKSSVAIMKKLSLKTTAEQELIVRTTGNITAMLDSDVAIGVFGRWLKQGKDWVLGNSTQIASKILLFLFVLLLFRVLAKMARRLTVNVLKKSKGRVSILFENMITSMVGRAVMILGFLVALSQVGFNLGPVLAGLGVAGFVIGFALQDTLSNFASGMMILFYRPFDVDDLVEAGGVFGNVRRMTLVSTTILTLDYQTLIVPNNKIWGDVIKNVTAQRRRRVDLTFNISYTDDIDKAERLLIEIAGDHPKVLKEPELLVRLHNLGESSVDFVVRPWVQTDDYWDVYWDITREVKMRFDREGISIPFPQREIHIVNRESAPAED